MSVTVACIGCRKSFRVNAAVKRKRLRCPQCGDMVDVARSCHSQPPPLTQASTVTRRKQKQRWKLSPQLRPLLLVAAVLGGLAITFTGGIYLFSVTGLLDQIVDLGQPPPNLGEGSVHNAVDSQQEPADTEPPVKPLAPSDRKQTITPEELSVRIIMRNHSDWGIVQSSDGRVTWRMPMKPSIKGDSSGKTYGVSLGTMEFVVYELPLPSPAETRTPAQRIKTLKEMMTDMGQANVRESSLGGQQGVTGDVVGDVIGESRMVIVGDTLYMFDMVGRNKRSVNLFKDLFFDFVEVRSE